MITCEQVLRELSNYLDEEISSELRTEIQEHLRDCHNCTVLADTTRKTITLVAAKYVARLPQGVSERLIARLGIR